MTSQMYFLDSIYCCSYQRQHHKRTFSMASIVVPIRGICLCAHAKMCNNKAVNNYKPHEESSDILIRKIGICCSRSSHCIRSLCIHCMINDPQQPLWSPGKSRKAMDFSRFLEKPPDVFEFFGLYIYLSMNNSVKCQVSRECENLISAEAEWFWCLREPILLRFHTHFRCRSAAAEGSRGDTSRNTKTAGRQRRLNKLYVTRRFIPKKSVHHQKTQFWGSCVLCQHLQLPSDQTESIWDIEHSLHPASDSSCRCFWSTVAANLCSDLAVCEGCEWNSVSISSLDIVKEFHTS